MTLVWMFHPSCPATLLDLPNSHQPKQNRADQGRADSRIAKIIVNLTQVRDLMPHTVFEGQLCYLYLWQVYALNIAKGLEEQILCYNSKKDQKRSTSKPRLNAVPQFRVRTQGVEKLSLSRGHQTVDPLWGHLPLPGDRDHVPCEPEHPRLRSKTRIRQ